jgi:hypothetical protein
MDSALDLRLEELPDSDALEREKAAIQATLIDGGSRIAKLHWALARDTALAGLKDCLGKLDALECFAKAWGTAAQLRKLALETANDPEAERDLALGEHPLTAVIHPVVTIRCDPIALPPLRFTLTLTADVQCVVLIVRGGKLHAIEAATMTPSARLSYAEHELGHFDCKPVKLGAPHVFADGGLTII